jgi:cysteine desulfuration protein SufE
LKHAECLLVDRQRAAAVRRARGEISCALATSPAHATLPGVSPAEKLQRLIDELSVVDDPQERLTWAVDRARRAPHLPPALRTDANRVHGCVSVVWLICGLREGRCEFRGDAESPIVRGLVVLLCDFHTDLAPAELAAFDTDPLEALALTRNLSPTRRNGLAAVRTAMRAFARSVAASA